MNPSKLNPQDFDRFFSCILVNKCTKMSITKIKNSSFIGVGELEFFEPKYYESSNEQKKVWVWGDFFISDESKQKTKLEKLFALLNQESIPFEKISGHYIIAYWDENSKKFGLFNSSFGMMPLYYAIKNNCLYFSSRLKSFIDAKLFPIDLNKNAILQYLIFNYVVSNDSFIKDVKLLPASTHIFSHEKEWSVVRYDNHHWLFNAPTVSFSEGEKLLDEALGEIISHYSELYKPFCCSITGGFDSRLNLSYLNNLGESDLFTYTYGKKSHSDMKVSAMLAKKVGVSHLPVFLDDDFVNSYVELAESCIQLSDGIRAANRGHYLLMAYRITEFGGKIAISGNCASNLMKIVVKPSSAYNKYVIGLFKGDGALPDCASDVYKSFFLENPWIKEISNKEVFVESIRNSEILTSKELNTSKRFYHYLLTNCERKYFGAEIASYASYIYNYSPFIDSDFIRIFAQTPYYGGHYNFLESNLLLRNKPVRLYAKLMKKNDSILARFTSGRGYPVTWFLSYAGLAGAYAIKKLGLNPFADKDPDPFNHKKGFTSIQRSWALESRYFNHPDGPFYSDEIVKAYSISKWIKNGSLL